MNVSPTIEVKSHRPVQLFINGVATVVAAGAITLAAGPALDQAVRWYTGKSYTLTDTISIPPMKSKAKPLDTPANTYATTYGSVTSSSYTSAEVLSLASYTPVPLVYAVTEPMPGAVTGPTGQGIEYVRATADDMPAQVFRLA
jgi:hypothetical protein